MTLRDKLAALTAPCREVDAEIAEMFGVQVTVMPLSGPHDAHGLPVPHYTASLDAAVELIERQMPGKNWSVVRYENRTTIACLGEGDRVIADGRHTIPAVAMLLALVNAKGIE